MSVTPSGSSSFTPSCATGFSSSFWSHSTSQSPPLFSSFFTVSHSSSSLHVSSRLAPSFASSFTVHFTSLCGAACSQSSSQSSSAATRVTFTGVVASVVVASVIVSGVGFDDSLSSATNCVSREFFFPRLRVALGFSSSSLNPLCTTFSGFTCGLRGFLAVFCFASTFSPFSSFFTSSFFSPSFTSFFTSGFTLTSSFTSSHSSLDASTTSLTSKSHSLTQHALISRLTRCPS